MSARMLVSIALMTVLGGTVLADHDHDRQRFFAEGRVTHAEPIYETYYYRESRGHGRDEGYEICRTRDVEVERRHSGGNPASTIIGGALGATVGSHAGHSRESQVFGAIAGGLIGGAIGHELGGKGETTVRYRTERECKVEYRHHRRELVGYEVRYRYNGREFLTFTERHPGRFIELEVEVTPRR